MNSDFSYLASKCFNLTSKNRSKSCTCPSISLPVQYLMQNHNWIDFGHFFHFFCKFPKRQIKKRMTTCKIILTPTNKEPKICHALATTSAFNLKLCPKICWRPSAQSSGVGVLDQTSAKERVGAPKDSQGEYSNLVAQHPAADRQPVGGRWFLLICLFPGPACQPSLW